MFERAKSILKLFSDNKTLWWRRPSYENLSEEEERKVNRLDLFYDLVFVIAIGQIAHMFHGEVTWTLVLQFFILFTPVWRIWINSVYYVERYEDLTVRHRVYMFAMMVPVLGIGYSIHGAFDDLSIWYVGSYVVSRLILRRLWATADRTSVDSVGLNTLAKKIGGINIVVAVLWIASIFVPEPWRYLIWYGTMLGELVYAYTLRDLNKDRPIKHIHHLTERFGLFTIIVLAEIIIGVFSGLTELHHMSMGVMITAVASFLIACLLWRIYFDQIMYRPLKSKEPQEIFLWTYAHLPLTLGIVAVGGGLTHVLHMVGDHLEPINLILITGSIFLTLVTLAYLTQFHKASDLTGEVVLHDDDHLNAHFKKTHLRTAAFVLIWGVVTLHFHLTISRYILGIVVLLGIVALEGLMHRLIAISDDANHDEIFHHHHHGETCGH